VELAIKGAVDIRLEINVAVWVLSAGGKRPSEVGIRRSEMHRPSQTNIIGEFFYGHLLVGERLD
jgi:hypothetical protein